MESSELKTGDIVVLNSGGPLMTVLAIHKAVPGRGTEDMTICAWAAEDMTVQRDEFPVASLCRKQIGLKRDGAVS